MKKHITIALSSIFMAAAGFGAHAATTQNTPNASVAQLQPVQAPASITVDDKELETYANAARKVNEISAEYAPKIDGAETEAEQRILIEQADQDMVRAVNTANIDVERFLEITQALQADPELAERFNQLIQK